MDTLITYTVATFILAVITYGTAVPSGLFVPCILIGSGYGRIAGEMMRVQFGPEVQPGVYALIGEPAASLCYSRDVALHCTHAPEGGG